MKGAYILLAFIYFFFRDVQGWTHTYTYTDTHVRTIIIEKRGK